MKTHSTTFSARNFLFLCAFTICFSSTYAQLPSWLPSNGLVAWYPFNGNANDESGNNRNGTVNGGTTLTSDRFGNANKAYQFDGTSGYIINSSFPTNYTAYSFTGWVKSDLTSTNQGCFYTQTGNTSSSGGENSSIGVSFFGTNVNARHRLGNYILMAIDFAPLEQTWNFYASTWDGLYLRVYKNGVFIDSAYYPTITTITTKFLIGSAYTGAPSYFFQGKLDDVAVYNRALTPSEIAVMYSQSTVSLPPWLPSNGLVAWYPFNGNANDESGNNRNGTINSGVTLTTDRFGNANSAYNFNGTSGYIRNDAFPTTLGGYTYFGWYKSELTSYADCNAYTQTGFNASGEVSSFGISSAGTVISARHRLSNMTLMGCGASPLDLNWNMLATTWDGQWVRVYKNGTKIDSAYYPNRSTLGSKFFIGCGFNYGNLISYFFQGKLDDIGVYNRALTQSEITGIYQGGQSPTFTSQPSNATVCKGGTATFSVTVAGSSPYYYQWYRNGYALPNGNQSVFSVFNAQLSDVGSYNCIVTNSYGNTQSNPASLTVIITPQPVIWGATVVPQWSAEVYSVTQTAGSTYQFSVINGNKISNTANSITVQWGGNGWGQVICSETTLMGCNSDPSILTVAIGSVGISEKTDNGIIIAPNPTTGQCRVSSQAPIHNIAVYAADGKIISEHNSTSQASWVDLSINSKGLFYLRITSDDGVVTRKVVVY